MTVKVNKRSTHVFTEDLGDWTHYYISLAELPNAVQVMLGGAQPPFIGGVIPNHMIEGFNELVMEWAYDIKIGHFQDQLFNWPQFIHLQGKQASAYYNKWDLAVALIFAWLFYWKTEDNEHAARIVGHMFNNDYEQGKHVVENVMGIAY